MPCDPEAYALSRNPLTSCTAKKKRQDTQAKRDANDRNISEYFTKGAVKVQTQPKVSK